MTNLADLLRSAEIELERIDLDTVQASLAKSVGNISVDSLPDLVRYAHREKPRDGDFFEEFQTPFREDDSGILLEGENELGAALAAASLIQLFETKSTNALSHAAAMLIESAEFLGWTPKAPALQSDAKAHLKTVGGNMRTRQTVYAATLSHKGFDEALKKLDAAVDTGQSQQLKEPLPAALTVLRDAARGLKDSTLKAVNALYGNQATLFEELDVYWWVSSGFSKTLEAPLSKAPKASVTLIAGIELGELVQLLPGPPGAAAYLETVLRPLKPKAAGTPLKEAVTALPGDFSIPLAGALSDNPEFSPLAFAVERHREAGDDTWTSAFKAKTGLNATKTVKPLALALQACNEILLARVLEQLDD